ncbi:FG-GAP-like repeat-containing protein [Acanthopleuribacter pedis]|uniref:VCBS repeat-containing protein n=1 Tax=Acanthopleuribacter pedis TaxID=442870 RepID=A0A8J7QQ62_9BACT|nr:VCBS repeat-containing protein [Acanthopleuribacter pedis]
MRQRHFTDSQNIQLRKLQQIEVHQRLIESARWDQHKTAQVYWEHDAVAANLPLDEYSGTMHYEAHGHLTHVAKRTPEELAELFAERFTTNPGLFENTHELAFLSCELSEQYVSDFLRNLHLKMNDHLPPGSNHDLDVYFFKNPISLLPEPYTQDGTTVELRLGSFKILDDFIRVHDFRNPDFIRGDDNPVDQVGKSRYRFDRLTPADARSLGQALTNSPLKNITLNTLGYQLYLSGLRLKQYIPNKLTYLARLEQVVHEHVQNLGSEDYTKEYFFPADHEFGDTDEYEEMVTRLKENLPENLVGTLAQDLIDEGVVYDNQSRSNPRPDEDDPSEPERDALGLGPEEDFQTGRHQEPWYTEVSPEERLSLEAAVGNEVAGQFQHFQQKHQPLLDIQPDFSADIVRNGRLSENTQRLRATLTLQHDLNLVAETMKAVVEPGFYIDETSTVTTRAENGDLTIRFRSTDQEATISRAHEITVPEEQLQSLKFIHEVREHGTTNSTREMIGRGMGVYGVMMGFSAGIQDLQKGEWHRAIIDLSQALHGAGSLSGLNAKAEAAAARAVGAAIRPAAQRLAAFAGAHGDIMLVRAATRLGTTLVGAGEAMSRLPIVGTAFGVYNVIQDLERNSTIGDVNAVLDSAIVTLQLAALANPGLEVVVLALVAVRIVDDIVYNDVAAELHKLGPDADFGDKTLAVLKGLGHAVNDFENTTNPLMAVGDMLVQDTILKSTADRQAAYIDSMADYHTFFRVRPEGIIDFTAGEHAYDIGEVHFQLGEPGEASQMSFFAFDKATGQMHEYYQKLAHINVSHDIVLGFGEAVNKIEMREVSSKFMNLITVNTYTMIDHLEYNAATRHGVYVGNSQDNTFYMLQENPFPGDKPRYDLAQYHYVIGGRQGNDRFIIGPQETFVVGGEGNDYYEVRHALARTTIVNEDETANPGRDRLQLPLTLRQVGMLRDGDDLQVLNAAGLSTQAAIDPLPSNPLIGKLKHTQQLHHQLVSFRQGATIITLQDYFAGPAHQHIGIYTEDGFLIEPVFLGDEQVDFKVTAWDLNSSVTPLAFMLHEGGHQGAWWHDIVWIQAGANNDWLFGNGQDNFLHGGGVNMQRTNNHEPTHELMAGYEGADTYLLQFPTATLPTNTPTIIGIYNAAQDTAVDQILIPRDFADIQVSGNDHLPRLNVPDWGNPFRGAILTFADMPNFAVQILDGWDHAVLVSRDGYHFMLETDENKQFQTTVLSINQEGLVQAPETLDLTLMPEVDAVQGARAFPNTIIGNARNNQITGGNQGNLLRGGDGRDLLTGGRGSDRLYGDGGDDELHGGGGTDYLFGGPGDDVLYGGFVHRNENHNGDYLDGGPGFDTALFAGDPIHSQGVSVFLGSGRVSGGDGHGDHLVSIEAVYGSPFADQFWDSHGDDWFHGDDGNDTLILTYGNDVFRGGNGHDRITVNIAQAKGTKRLINLAEDGRSDTLTLIGAHADNMRFAFEGEHGDLVITTTQNPSLRIVVQDFQRSALHRHLDLWTDDGFSPILGDGKLAYVPLNGRVFAGHAGAFKALGQLDNIAQLWLTDAGEPWVLTHEHRVYCWLFDRWREVATPTRMRELQVVDGDILHAHGFDDILWRRRGFDGQWEPLSAFNPDHNRKGYRPVALFPVAGTNRNDLLAYNRHTRTLATFQAETGVYLSETPTQASTVRLAADSQVLAAGDFDGDGQPDWLTRDRVGTLALVRGGVTDPVRNLVASSNGWSPLTVGNFDGRAGDELLVVHEDTRALALWRFDTQHGLSIQSLTSHAPTDTVFAGDFDGNGWDDLAWEQPGELTVWLMNGGVVTAARTYQAPNDQTLRTVGDFDGDGREDLLLRGDDESFPIIWHMNGLGQPAVGTYTAGVAGFPGVMAGDLNGDGRSDLVWYDHNGFNLLDPFVSSGVNR